MVDTKRRTVLGFGLATASLMTLGCQTKPAALDTEPENPSEPDSNETQSLPESETEETPMQIRYLEIVTPEVDAVCDTYGTLHGVTFSEPEPSLGGARTAELSDGGVIGVRGPLRADETPVVRPYLFVDDIQAAVDAAKEKGAEIAVPPMELPGQGTFAIFIQGGIESGLWQR